LVQGFLSGSKAAVTWIWLLITGIYRG
jgi:hypothetical protein